MTNNQLAIISHVLVQIPSGSVVDEATILGYIKVFKILNPVSDDEQDEILKELHSQLAVRMDRGACVKEKNHVSWYYTAKRNIKPTFWNRYSIYLRNNEGFNSDVINAMDSATDEMMDMLGNPASTEEFGRRGLVIGDVQSGKTSTYISLINKAADSGYRIIILLTGDNREIAAANTRTP